MTGDKLNPAQLLVPAIRWDNEHGFDNEREKIDLALSLGVGGFIFFGGNADSVKQLVLELRDRSNVPLLVGADLERGAGQQFHGCTQLPPAAALGHLDDLDVIRKAAIITAEEAKSLSLNWVYAPMCDLDVEPNNPIVGTRSFGSVPKRVAEIVSEWVDACQSRGVMACAKHFPGHGRTVTDSHAELPSVSLSEAEIYNTDLVPFRAAIDAGVASVMTAHVSFPGLDPSNAPATLSKPILHDLLRNKLGFDGIVVTDAFIMQGILDAVGGGTGGTGGTGDTGDTGGTGDTGDTSGVNGGVGSDGGGANVSGEQSAAIRAIEAGCDILLYPEDIRGVARALERVDPNCIRDALRRRERWAEWCVRLVDGNNDFAVNAEWADQVAARSVHVLRNMSFPALSTEVDVITVDDDIGGPYPPPPRNVFIDELRKQGINANELKAPSLDVNRTVVIALYGDIRAWKGRAGYSDTSLQAVHAACDTAYRAGQRVVIVQFSHPRLASQLPGNVPVLCAWGGEAIMQRAAARKLLKQGS